MKARDFESKFDAGEDVTANLDLSRARRPGLEQRRVNVDFPAWMVESLDREARRLGVTRQSVIKVWIAEAARGADALKAPDRSGAACNHPRTGLSLLSGGCMRPAAWPGLPRGDCQGGYGSVLWVRVGPSARTTRASIRRSISEVG